MTLVTIDLGDVAGGHDPDDHVIIRAEAFREAVGGGITSTAEVKIPLVNGVGQAEVEPGPVVVSFRCQAVADTREKRGVVPSSGTVGIERVLEGNLTYTPPVVDRILEIINGTIDSIKWERPAITSGTNLNLVLKSGSHSVPSYEVAETLINRPQNTEAVDRAELRVFGSSSGIHQTWTPIRAAGLLSPIMHRRRDNVGTWTPWVRLDDISAESRAAIMAEIGVAAWLKSALTGSENLNDLRTPGMYRVSTYAIANSLPNRPTLKTAINPAILEVKSLATGQVEQVWTTLPAAGVDAPVMSRRRDNGGVWTPWVRPGAKVTLLTGDDLNEFIDDVVLNVRTYSVANSLLNSPKSVSATSINRAVVTVTSAGGHTSQIWRSLPAAHQESEMLSRHRDSTGAWSEWSLGEDDLVDGSTRSHQLHDRGLIRLATQYSQDSTPVWGWSAPPGEYLTIPTHEGSGQAIHPSVLYFPSGWNGWKYWMAHTPYPNFAEGHEDPNIVVSNDGTTWQVPAGLTNPLDDQTGRPSPHNSDTHLTMGPDGQMVMSWRMVNRPEGARNQFFWRTSTDGVTWTPKREIWAPAVSDYHSSTVSQSLTWMGDRWRMYFISSTPAPNQLVWVETTDRTPSATSWGAPVTCTFDFPIPRDRDFWHVETQHHNGQWIGIISDGNRGSTGTNGSIYLMRSSDGTAWEVSPVPLVPQVGDRHDSLYKTGFVVSGTGANMSLDVYYSAYDRTSRVWGTWRTKAVYVGGAPKAPLVTQSDLDLRVPEGAIDSLGQRITDEKWNRGPVPGGSLDTLVAPGTYSVTGAIVGKPADADGSVTVSTGASSGTVQVYTETGSGGLTWTRNRVTDTGTWNPWQEVSDNAWRRRQLFTQNLNDVVTPGIWGQHLTGSATAARNYPVARRGTLIVGDLGSGIISQTYLANTGHYRERQGDGTWLDWYPLGGGGGTDPAESWVKDLLASTHIDTITANGAYRQAYDGLATTTNGYPEGAARGVLQVVAVSGTISHQMYVTSASAWVRNVVSGVPTPWVEVGNATVNNRLTALEAASDNAPGAVVGGPGGMLAYGRTMPDPWKDPTKDLYWAGPNGTKFFPAGYRGSGFVGAVGKNAGYRDMVITKEASDNLYVSAVNPDTGRHVTWMVEGKGADDMPIVGGIWVGDMTAEGTASRDVQLTSRSNMEFAIRINIDDVEQYVPWHGDNTAIAAGPTVFTDSSGNVIDIEGYPHRTPLTGLDGFKVHQTMWARHPSTGERNLARIEQVSSFSPDGLFRSETYLTVLETIRIEGMSIGNAPINAGLSDTFHVWGGASHSIPAGTGSYQEVELSGAEKFGSGMFTGPNGIFAAISLLDPETTRADHAPWRTSPGRPWIQIRPDGFVKFYHRAVGPGQDLPAGMAWSFGAEWRYGEDAEAVSLPQPAIGNPLA